LYCNDLIPMESAIDLTKRDRSFNTTRGEECVHNMVPIVRPVPRPAWTIMWYHNIWALRNTFTEHNLNSPVRYPGPEQFFSPPGSTLLTKNQHENQASNLGAAKTAETLPLQNSQGLLR